MAFGPDLTHLHFLRLEEWARFIDEIPCIEEGGEEVTRATKLADLEQCVSPPTPLSRLLIPTLAQVHRRAPPPRILLLQPHRLSRLAPSALSEPPSSSSPLLPPSHFSSSTTATHERSSDRIALRSLPPSPVRVAVHRGGRGVGPVWEVRRGGIRCEGWVGTWESWVGDVGGAGRSACHEELAVSEGAVRF